MAELRVQVSEERRAVIFRILAALEDLDDGKEFKTLSPDDDLDEQVLSGLTGQATQVIQTMEVWSRSMTRAKST